MVLAAVVVTIVSVAGGSGSRSGTLINGVDYNLVPGANLAGANLSGAVLTNVDLSGADLTGANLNNATLTGTKFGCITVRWWGICANFTNLKASGIVGVPASLPAKWVLKSGFLLGPTVNLVGLNFRNNTSILSGTSASNLDLTGANLTNADLYSAGLTYVILTNANLTGIVATQGNEDLRIPRTAFVYVTWNNTTCKNGSLSQYNPGSTCVNIGY